MISFCPAESRFYNALFVKAEHVSGSLDYHGHRHIFDKFLEDIRPQRLNMKHAFSFSHLDEVVFFVYYCFLPAFSLLDTGTVIYFT